jgi:hypothetical protein
MKKSQNMLVWLSKMPQQSCADAREECNKYELTSIPSVIDFLIGQS